MTNTARQPITDAQIETLLNSHAYITDIERKSVGDEMFKREFRFTVRGVKYRIVWHINNSTLYVGEVEIPFTRLEGSNTWPNRFKVNLQFYFGDTIVAIIPVQEYSN